MTEPQVEIDSGLLAGRRRNGVLRFDGIPYAAPPLGRLRFAPPHPVEPWAGVRPARAPTPGPLQLPGPTFGSRPVGATSEDCLHLNVVTPGLRGRRPVLVWIYGGGYVNGCAADPIHAGERLAELGDVVLVTLDYRLGVFGFLHTAEATNLGLKDQLAALAWVQRNIAAFGGDPNRVTLFGESAGANCVLTLMGVPSADTSFQAGIIQSGAAHWISDEAGAERTRAAFAAEVGTDDPKRWRALPAGQLLAAQDRVASRIRAETGRGAFRPLLDGALVTADGQTAQQRARNRQRPLIVGSNADEQRLFLVLRRPMDRTTAGKRLARALADRCADNDDTAAELLAGYERLYPAWSELERLAAAETMLQYRLPLLELAASRPHPAPTWNYLFAWKSPALRGRLGACHALEIPFVFGTLDAPGMTRFAGGGAAAWALSRRMNEVWAAFARDGAPTAAVNDWAAWNDDDRWAWIADREPRVVRRPLDAEHALWKQTLPTP